MARDTLTPVFPMSVNPVHEGVYRWNHARSKEPMYSKWTGKFWTLSAWEPDIAEGMTVASMEYNTFGKWRAEFEITGWQGVTEPPVDIK